MTFREALDTHLQAIQDRDLETLTDTLAPDELVLITARGELFNKTEDFVRLHRGWFEQTSWSLAGVVVHVAEGSDLAAAVIHLEYRDTDDSGNEIHELSYLTLIFRLQDGRWLLVHDQNTPIRT